MSNVVVRVLMTNPSMPAVTTTGSTTPATPAAVVAKTRLLKLTIAKFYGEVTNWTS